LHPAALFFFPQEGEGVCWGEGQKGGRGGRTRGFGTKCPMGLDHPANLRTRPELKSRVGPLTN